FAKGISGSRLAEQAYEQALVFGASFAFIHQAVGLAPSGDLCAVALENGRRVEARVGILAMGATYRRLAVGQLEDLHAAGGFYVAPVSEARALSGKQAFVLGGGNSAGQAALHLARYARNVSLIVRGDDLARSMSRYLIRELEATANVDLLTSTTIVGGGG